jgi:regulator of protease activity HflC (stomatin/prohibitin superfamily)
MEGLPEVSAATTCRIGRSPGDTNGAGLHLVFAPCERMTRASLRTQVLEVPTQIVATRDDVTVKVDAAIFFRVIDARLAILGDPSFLNSTSQLAQTVLRCVMGKTTLDELLSKRGKLHVRLHSVVDRHVAVWGMKVTLVEVNHVEVELDPTIVWTDCEEDRCTWHGLDPADSPPRRGRKVQAPCVTSVLSNR